MSHSRGSGHPCGSRLPTAMNRLTDQRCRRIQPIAMALQRLRRDHRGTAGLVEAICSMAPAAPPVTFSRHTPSAFPVHRRGGGTSCVPVARARRSRSVRCLAAVVFSDVRASAVSVTSPRANLSYASSYAFALFFRRTSVLSSGARLTYGTSGSRSGASTGRVGSAASCTRADRSASRVRRSRVRLSSCSLCSSCT